MRGSANKTVTGLLDLGSSKVCCAIVDVPGGAAPGATGPEQVRILGFGHHRSGGVKAGLIVDLDAAELAVRAAVAQAEHEAGVRLEKVLVGVSAGRLASLNFNAEVNLARRVVGVDDLANLREGAREYAERSGRVLVSLNEVDFQLDGASGISDPRGLAGQKLAAEIHAVTADAAPLRNISVLVRRCFLEVSGFIATGGASALAATTVEEREAGVVCIDVGGGVMTTAVFRQGRFVHTDVAPFGFSTISTDIARDLAISFGEAERLKTLHGSVLHAVSDETDVIGYDAVVGGATVRKKTVRAHVRRIVEDRLRLLLGLIAERLENLDTAMPGGQRIVLTGGGSQLLGVGELAANVFGRPVRIGGPHGLGPGGHVLAGPAFSTIAGMLPASLSANHLLSGKLGGETGFEGSLGRVGRWLRESF